jgi:acylphosphatase
MSKSDKDRARLRLIISGRVHGVYFRASAAAQAEKFGLTGFARNLPNHKVEIVAEGPIDALKSLVQWAHHGPPDARVDNLSEQWLPFLDEFDSFSIA